MWEATNCSNSLQIEIVYTFLKEILMGGWGARLLTLGTGRNLILWNSGISPEEWVVDVVFLLFSILADCHMFISIFIFELLPTCYHDKANVTEFFNLIAQGSSEKPFLNNILFRFKTKQQQQQIAANLK